MPSLDLSANDLNGWLDLLAGSAEGTIKFINLYFCLDLQLVSEDVVRLFLIDCISRGATTSDTAFADFSEVCGCDASYSMLCRVNPTSIPSTSTLVTTMSSFVFHEHILRRPSTLVKRTFPPEPASHDDADETSYRNALNVLMAEGDWYQEDGTLGKTYPDPKFVWYTCLQYLEAEIAAGPSRDNKATRARDTLGLIETRHNTYLLAVEFPASCTHAICGLKMARPGFGDQGSRRFAVHLEGAAGNLYRDKWGVAVHLGKLKSRPPQEFCGAPERICEPLPLSDIGPSLVVEPLGWVIGNSGEEIGIDDDKAFIDRITGRMTLADIKKKVMTVANKP